MPGDRRVARDLVDGRLPTVAADAPLAGVIARLVEGHEDETAPQAILVVEPDERYAGILTARLLLQSLLARWSPTDEVRDDPARLAEDLHSVVADRTDLSVRDALVAGLPIAAPNERLVDLIERVTQAEIEYLPVVEEGRALGVVPVQELFYEIARLVLTPEDEGIQT